MGAYDGLNAFFEGSLCDYALNLGYDASNILILQGNYEALRRDYFEVYKNLLSCRHHSDCRTPLQYGQDLVASWVFEDFFLEEIQKGSLKVELAGADRSRMVLPNQRTSASSDFVLTTLSGSQILMELVNDYTGFWARNHVLHLRDNKYLHLRRNQCLLLAITLTKDSSQYALFDFRENIPARYIPRHAPYGFKPAYELNIFKNQMANFSIEKIYNHLLRII